MIRLMIADDQKIIRESLSKLISLDDEIELVCEAENGMDVLKKLEAHIIDVVLMDIKMPIMDGIAATKEIRKNDKDIAIILLTSFNEEEYILDGIKSGVNGYILKDSNVDYILMSIKEAYYKNILLDPRITPKLVNIFNDEKEKFNEDLYELLTDREKELVDLICKGYSNKEIGSKLYISEGTVKNYVSKILKITKLKTRTQLVIYANKINF